MRYIERKLTKGNYFFIGNNFFQIKFLQKFDIKHVVESKYCFRQEFLAKNVNLICQKNNNNVNTDLFQARVHFTFIKTSFYWNMPLSYVTRVKIFLLEKT